MNIKLYYIEGISMIDTPSFSISHSDFGNILSQETYFNSKLVKSIESSFYPPYYKNKIKVDKDDFSLDEDSINYLSIQYCNKTYYYFINRIEYISENVLYLHITMDVIQTFYFNLKIENGIIERKCINRWDGNNINRPNNPSLSVSLPYIRENVSKGQFQQVNYHICNNPSQWFIVSLMNKFHDGEGGDVLAKTFVYNHNSKSLDSSSNFYYYNLFTMISTFAYSSRTIGETVYDLNGPTFTTDIAPNEYCDIMYLCPFNPFIHIETYYEEGSSSLKIDWNSSYFEYRDDSTSSARYPEMPIIHSWLEPLVGIRTYDNNYTYTFNFIKNINRNVLFQYNYEPFLLDENYFKIEFGSSAVSTSFPLHNINKLFVHCKYGIDLSSGVRHYYINDDGSLNDKYGTRISDNNVLHLGLKTNRYYQYLAANKFRWQQAISSGLLNAGQNVMYGVTKAGGAGGIMGGAEGIASFSNRMINQVFTEGNYQWSPVQNKQSQDANISILNYDINIAVRISCVIDIKNVALYYHNYGYRVDELISPTTTIFGDVFNRYYFNVLKTRDINVHLIDYIETDEITEKIKERLNNGLRLWNVRNDDVIIGDLHYDNVEDDYLQ